IFIPAIDRIHSAGERLLRVVDALCDPVADRKIDELSMHHEVRTPLNQVIGYAEMLQEQAKDLGHDSFASDLQNVHTAGRRLLELIVENFASIRRDLIMPVMDGFVGREQRTAGPLLRDIPVIVLSASDELDHVVECIQMGAQDYVSKPLSQGLLQARIGSCLERKRLRDQET